jgi:hypothetical protein
MQEHLSIYFTDSEEIRPFILTYAIHKELQELLSEGGNLFDMFNNQDLAYNVLSICLSDRNEMGNIIKEFTSYGTVTAESSVELLDYVFEYFTNFFSAHRQIVEEAIAQMEKNNPPAQ